MISASLQQRKTRTRRSMLFVPGANAAMVSNSFIYPADALMFDLEDSVALREKDTARRMVYHALQHPLYRDIETIVRVNALDSEWGVNDLEAVVRGGADVVRLPKTDTAQDVLDIEKEILRIEWGDAYHHIPRLKGACNGGLVYFHFSPVSHAGVF